MRTRTADNLVRHDPMNNGWIRDAFRSVLSWLITHGFVLNSREWASLLWLGVIAIVVLWKLDIRSNLIGVLKIITNPKVASAFIFYFVWILILICVVNRIGIWRAMLTKDTLLWSTTAGLALLLTSAETPNLAYFWRTFRKAVNGIVILEYLVNTATFSIWIEFFVLQPLLFIALVLPSMAKLPSIAKDPEQQKACQYISTGLLIAILAVVGGYNGLLLSASWETVNKEIFILEMTWPLILGMWVLIFVFALAVITDNE